MARSTETRTPTDLAARSFSRDARSRSPKRDCWKTNATKRKMTTQIMTLRNVVVSGTPIVVLVPRVIEIVWFRKTLTMTRMASVPMPAGHAARAARSERP